jgi:hypothetical protein
MTVNDIDAQVERALRSLTAVARKVARAATWLLVLTVIVCGSSFWLGLEALSGAGQTAWIILGGVFGAIAIWSAAVARWRIGFVRRNVPQVAADVRTLISQGGQQAQTVIDVFQDDELGTGSAMVVSRNVFGARGLVGQGVASSAKLTYAIHAITSFPWLALVSTAISLVFGFLAMFFLLALAL